MTDVTNSPTPRRASMLERHVALVRTGGLAVLLVFLIAAIFVIPAILGNASSHHDDLVVVCIMVGGIIAIADRHRIAIALLVLTLAFIAVRLSGAGMVVTSPIYRDALILAAMLLLAVAVGINVFGRGHSLSDRVFGAIVLYLLLGVIWAVAYALTYRLVPHAFAGQLDAPQTFGDWAYFSVVTLTTLGYGDITPVARVARALATSEGLIGQLYPAIIIGRLVSLQASDK